MGWGMFNKVEICGVNTATLKVLSESEKMRLLREMRATNWSMATCGWCSV